MTAGLSWGRLAWALLLVLSLAGVTACGGNDGPADKCADKFCAYGVCNSETGECENALLCEPIEDENSLKESRCLEGYACNDGVCEAERPCGENEPCARGVCSDGTCLDADSCDDRTDCLPGKGCSAAGMCENLCEETSCERGVCNPETGECLNPTTCDPDDDSTASCLDGYKCLTQTDGANRCLDERDYCDQLDCDRGRCSFEQERCVDRESCSADEDCAVGNYCDTEIGECLNNACDEQMTTCDRGDCNRSTGECVNPESCSASEECLPDHECVEGRCLPSDEACGPNGCPGNQVCAYDPDRLSAECEVASGASCRNAIDCTGNSICRQGECVSPAGCQPDEFEPNDSTQVSFLDSAVGGNLEANLCGAGDVDRFSYDSDAARDGVVRGTMIVELAIEPVDVGQGQATLTVTNQSGDILARQSTDQRGRIYLEKKLSAGDFDEFQFKVSGTNLNPAGLRYSLFADIAPESVVQACRNAELVPADQGGGTRGSVVGNTQGGNTVALDSSCAEDGTATSDAVYSFTVRRESYVTVEMVPQTDADLTLALRRRCASSGSEMACADQGGRFEAETVARRLVPGTYTAIVQGARSGENGTFNLSYNKNEIICSAADNRCLTDSRAEVCVNNGTALREQICSNSCDETLGRCVRPAGDSCFEAIQTGGAYSSDEINWNSLSDQFDPSQLCGGTGSDNTEGPDAVHEVTVPAGEYLDASFDVGSESAAGALYLQSNCEDPASTCLELSDTDGSAEEVVYQNTSAQDETLYLVADTARGTEGTGSIDIKTGPRVCEPNTSVCDGSTQKECVQSGIEYETTQCQYGCADGECNPPPYDTCGGAVDLTGGGSATGNWDELNGDYNASSSCVGDDTPGEDGVYSVDLASDDVMTVDVQPSNSDGDPAIYISSDCSSASSVESSCITGVDEDFGGDSETLNFSPSGTYSGTKTFYIVVDSDETSGGSSGANGQYTIDVNVQSPICSPGETQCASGSSDTLEICSEFGLQYNQYTCQGSNTSCQAATSTDPAVCPEPTAEVCADPIELDKNGSIQTSGGNSDDLELEQGTTGGCQLGSDSDGDDQFYRIDLEKDDLLTADLDSSENEAQLYIMGECVQPSSCRTATSIESANQELQYRADEDETIFLVVDSANFGDFNGSYTLDLNTTPNTTCVPDTFSCTAPDKVSRCNAIGTDYDREFQCSTTCTSGSCEPPTGNPAPQSSCQTAPKVGQGTVLTDNWGNYSNDINLSASSCGLGTAADGSESVYAVDVLPGEIVNATLQNVSGGFDDPALYILSQCTSPNSNCVAGDAVSSGEASVTYTAQNSTTLYVVADNSYSTNNSSDFKLTIDKQAPNCSPGTKNCTSGNQGIEYCKPNGISETYACNGQCTSGTCANPTGNRCVDPVELSNGDTFSSSFSSFDNNLDPDAAACGVLPGTSTPDGPDAIFKLSGYAQGDTIVASLDQAPGGVNMYILDGCPFETTDPSARCDYGVQNENELKYYNESGGDKFLVVDAKDSSESEDFTVSLSKETGDTCQPGGGSCAGGALSICQDDGDAVDRTVNCASACQPAGYCEAPSTPNSTCTNAHPVDGGTRLIDDFSRMSSSFDPSCVNDNSSGNDAVYSLSLPAGESVEAVVEPLAGGADLGVYFLSDCNSPGSACLSQDSVDNGSTETQPVRAGYKNSSNSSETVYFVVDKGGGPDVSYLLDVTVTSPECTSNPSSQPTICIDSETEGVCTPWEQYAPRNCYFGCDTSSGACNPPPNDTCSGAISVTENQTYYTNIGSYADDYDVSDTSSGVSSCVSSGSSGGPDAVYQVQLDAGQYFAGTVNAPGDPVVWATTDCSSSTAAADSCTAGTNDSTGNTEDIVFSAPSDDTYYIMVDTDTSAGPSNPSGETSLQVDVAGDALCVPGQRSCSSQNGDVIQYCTSVTSQQEKTCSGTCSNGECTQLHGDFCEDAVQAQNGTSDSFGYGSYTDDYDLSSTSCVGFSTGGGDKVYEVDLDPNETLDVSISSSNSGDIVQGYVTTACGDASTMESTCVTGNDFGSSSGTLTFSPNISSTKTYFVVVDGWLTPTGTVSVNFTIN